MSRFLLLLAVGCAGKQAVATTMPPIDELEVRVDHVELGTKCAPPCSGGHAFLSLRNGTQPAKVRVLRVTISGELVVGAHAPAIEEQDRYEPWNETVGAEDAMWIRYDLDRVDWDHFAKPQLVRAISVIVEVDGRERVFGVPSGDPVSIDDFAAF